MARKSRTGDDITQMDMNKIDRVRSAPPDTYITEEEYVAKLMMATERSMRVSTYRDEHGREVTERTDWCPESCTIDESDPWACNHGLPLTEEQRTRQVWSSMIRRIK